MTGKILNCLRINRSMNQIRNIGAPQLMRSHLKVQTVNHISIVCRLLPQNRLHRMLYPLAIFIAIIAAFLCGTGYDILP